MKLPNHIKKKIEQYVVHSQKANEKLNEINAWFKGKGIDSEIVEDSRTDDFDIVGGMIQDILIDGAVHGDVKRIISAIENEF